jgi:hypothetical protein
MVIVEGTGRSLQSCVLGALAVLALSLLTACGGSPSSPGPVTPPPGGGGPPTPTPNLPPVIESISASTDRVEVGTDVTLTATVKDIETPVDQLKFVWQADAGSIAGEGATVKWRAPTDAATPKDYTVSLRVTETYGTADPTTGVRPTNVANGTSPVIRVHNSPKELSDMGLLFINDFTNSALSSGVCLRNFTDSCPGKASEKSDIDYNREHYTIVGSSIKLTGVRVASSGLSADIDIACTFTSIIIKCDPTVAGCVVGAKETVEGDCALTGKYELKRWWLCDSNFIGRKVSLMFQKFWR